MIKETKEILESIIKWMPRCSCGNYATIKQTWSDRECVFCEKEECRKQALSWYKNDHEYDKIEFTISNLLWKETAILLNEINN